VRHFNPNKISLYFYRFPDSGHGFSSQTIGPFGCGRHFYSYGKWKINREVWISCKKEYELVMNISKTFVFIIYYLVKIQKKDI